MKELTHHETKEIGGGFIYLIAILFVLSSCSPESRITL